MPCPSDADLVRADRTLDLSAIMRRANAEFAARRRLPRRIGRIVAPPYTRADALRAAWRSARARLDVLRDLDEVAAGAARPLTPSGLTMLRGSNEFLART